MTDFRQDHPDGIVLAVDQMSAYLQATLTRVGATRTAPVVQVTSQRDMLHSYGALDVIGGHEIALSLPKRDGDHTVHFLHHVLNCFPGRALLLLLDRAPWHKGKARQFIEDHPLLDLIYFPPACPDLNPQEHVWKQARDAVGHLRDYPHLSNVRRAFQSYLENTPFHFDWIDQYLPKAFYEFEFI